MSKKLRPRVSELKSEIHFDTARSSGPGGQHANKVETKVILSLEIENSQVLNNEQKRLIKEKYNNKINKEGQLLITCESTRSQLKNKELAFKKLDRLLSKAFQQKKVRKKSKPSKGAIEKRIKEKKIQSEKKASRQKPQGY